jgi:hypothetical protein
MLGAETTAPVYVPLRNSKVTLLWVLVANLIVNVCGLQLSVMVVLTQWLVVPLVSTGGLRNVHLKTKLSELGAVQTNLLEVVLYQLFSLNPKPAKTLVGHLLLPLLLCVPTPSFQVILVVPPPHSLVLKLRACHWVLACVPLKNSVPTMPKDLVVNWITSLSGVLLHVLVVKLPKRDPLTLLIHPSVPL